MRSTMAFVLLDAGRASWLPVLFQAQAGHAARQPQAQAQPAQPSGTSRAAARRPSRSRPPRQAQAPAATPAIAAALETETTVENELYKIVFTNRGAQVKHWILKKYFDTAGKPLDMVQPQAAARFGYPLSLFTYEPALTDAVEQQALYQVTVSGAQPSATGYVLAPAPTPSPSTTPRTAWTW